jgi:recombination protein RecA
MTPLLQIPFALAVGDSPGAARRLFPVEPPEREPQRAPRRWNLESLAGGITEISAPAPAAGLTAAARLVREAQERGEPAAWIAAGDSLFYAPDLHDWGVDLAALPVARVGGALAAARVAECLLRSGAFALIVFDLGRTGGSAIPGGPGQGTARNRGFAPTRGASPCARFTTLPPAVQVRLAALCRRHETALLLLAQKPEGTPPIASMAILRAEGTARKTGFDRFTFELKVLKDKRQGTGWSHEEVLRGPDGLC